VPPVTDDGPETTRKNRTSPRLVRPAVKRIRAGEATQGNGLVMRRSWVRFPPATPSLTCANAIVSDLRLVALREYDASRGLDRSPRSWRVPDMPYDQRTHLSSRSGASGSSRARRNVASCEAVTGLGT
jgi:hypothetical protein